ncbi:hypothetical protein [Streptomyces sp. SID13031]|nr:hypothetical protein [Streptomyces sp. SID13031]NEA31889.1 hypothetical protein [Streptomyces sp. SID13031]
MTGLRGALDISILTGTDWDATSRGFTNDCEEQHFNEPLDRGYNWQFDV